MSCVGLFGSLYLSRLDALGVAVSVFAMLVVCGALVFYADWFARRHPRHGLRIGIMTLTPPTGDARTSDAEQPNE